MKNKGLVGLAKLSAGVLILVLGFVLSLVYILPAEGADQNVNLVGPDWIIAPNPNYQIMFSIANVDSTENITGVNITLPNGFVYIINSNFTTASNADFSNYSSVLSWTNQTLAPLIQAGASHNFSFNVSVPNVPGVYTFNITTIDNTSTTNTSYINISVQLPFQQSPLTGYEFQCGGNPCPVAVNTSKTVDLFFYDGNTVYIVVNFTNQNGGVPGLNVTGDFSQIGGSGLVYATYLGNGIYELNDTVNYSSIPGGVRNVQQANVTINATNTTDWSYYQTLTAQSVLLVNMTGFGCPPDDDPNINVTYPATPGYNLSSGTPVTTPIQAVGCTQNATLCQYMDTYGPGTYNGTDWVICAPQFGPLTTDLNQIAASGNFSDVPLVIEVPGKALINFTAGVDLSSAEKASAIMEFAVRNLMGAGKVGINDSEWNGQGNKPNLTISARLTLYNLSGLLGITDPAIGFGAYTGPIPENLTTCPPSRCTNIVWDGENLTFTVSTFSTYVATDALHNLTFVNNTALTSTAITNQVVTYIITITNNGNATSETYNLSVVGIGTLNASSITLLQGESTQVELNVTNATAGQYTSYIVAYHYNGTDTETDWNLSSADDGVIFTTTIINPNLTIHYPPNGGNITSTNGVDLNFSSNTVLDTCVYSINGTANVSIPNCVNITIGAGNFTEGTNQNITIYYNDTYGNGGAGLTLYATTVFSIDNTPPEHVAITTHTNEQNVSGVITINASVSDSVTGVYSVQLKLTNSTGYILNIFNMNEYDSAGNYTATLNTTQYPDGKYNLTIVATDYSGNVNSSYYINLTFDNTAPSVVIVEPTSGEYRRASVLINVSVSDPTTSIDTVRYNISNSTWSNVVDIPVYSAPYYNITLDTTTLQDGSYTITILANNTAGVVNDTESVTINVDNTAPQLSNWSYNFITQQLTLNFDDVIDISSITLSFFNITWNDGTVALNGLTSATVHTSSNSSSIVINFTTLQDNTMRDLRSKRDSSEGKIYMLAGAVKDRAGNNALAKSGLAYTSYITYGIEIDLTGSVWNSFNLPRTVLENRTSLGGNYSVENVLSSIAGNYQIIYYYDGSSWTSYVPGRITNDFTTFTDDTGTNTYWIYMTTGDKLQIQ